jgi:putative hydrolase of the HAD superfamily
VGVSGARIEDESLTVVNQCSIRAVTFDVGNTLIEPRISVGHIYAEVAATHGITRLSPEQLNTRFHQAFRANGGVVDTRADWARIVDDTFTGLTVRPPSETFFPELFDRFLQPETWRIYDDVRPALHELAKHGVRLGVISNWDSRLRPLLEALDLAKYFEVFVVSCEAGCAKPAREIFETARLQFSLHPNEILHVGDSIAADVEGARTSGFRSLQIMRGMASGRDMIGSLHELTSRLEHLAD